LTVNAKFVFYFVWFLTWYRSRIKMWSVVTRSEVLWWYCLCHELFACLLSLDLFFFPLPPQIVRTGRKSTRMCKVAGSCIGYTVTSITDTQTGQCLGCWHGRWRVCVLRGRYDTDKPQAPKPVPRFAIARGWRAFFLFVSLHHGSCVYVSVALVVHQSAWSTSFLCCSPFRRLWLESSDACVPQRIFSFEACRITRVNFAVAPRWFVLA
jgi:hypothetical protein